MPASLKKAGRIGKREIEQKPPQVAPEQKLLMPPPSRPGPPSPPVVGEEGFVSTPYNFGSDRPTYASQANDYKLGCSMYGVCSPVEGFQSGPGPVGTGAGSGVGMGPAATRCGPLELPVLGDMYGDQVKADMKKALDVSLAQNSSPGAGYTPPTNYKTPVDMAKVTGVYDEEIESYLHSLAPPSTYMTVEQEVKGGQPITALASPQKYTYTNEKDANKETTDVAAALPGSTGPVEELLQSINASLKALYNTASVYNPKQNWWDLAVFVLAGVLIIFLLEQLFQIASAIGMRNTINQLEPYLKSLQSRA
jgi:hypothetical protein